MTKPNLKKTAILLIFALAAVALAAFYAAGDFLHGSLIKPVCITVSPGSGTIKIANTLGDCGAVRSPALFRCYIRLTGSDDIWNPGDFYLGPGDGYRQIAEAMSEPVLIPDVRITIREGLQIPEIGKLLEESGICGKADFAAACAAWDADRYFLTDAPGRRKLEGFLFPDTYRFYPDSDPNTVIERMLDRFEEMVCTPERLERAAETGYSLDEIITLASMLESEAVTQEDRRRTAGVFYNRLERTPGRMLQSCVTVEFALGIHKNILARGDLDVDSPYNTYRHSGLPVGPICCPGLISIDAALWPEENSYYFFQSDKYGNLWFAETYAEHARIHKEVQADWAVKTRIVGE